MFGNRLFIYFLSALLSVAAVIGGLGTAYQRHLNVPLEYSIIDGIARDGWLSKRAELRVPALASRGNTLTLQFAPTRPAVPDARMRISVCSGERQEYLVGASTTVAISLRAACEPRIITIEVLDTFRASPTDQRDLGAQLVAVNISSRLGLPLLQERVIIIATAILFLLSICGAQWLFLGRARWIALIVPLVALYPLTQADPENLMKPLWLGVTLLSVLLGVWLGSRSGVSHTATLNLSPALGHRPFTVLLLLCAAGAVLRFYGLNFGLPYNYHPDEIPKVNAIMRMVSTHSLDPHYFLHPSLLLYCTYAMNTLFHLVGMEGEFRTSAFLAGRTVSALAGTVSIPLLFALGRRLFGTQVALTAAALLAVMPLHVTCSRYLKEDALLTSFILLTAVLVVKASQEGRKGLLFAAAACAGLAASTKYSGILAVGLIMAAPWLRSGRWTPDWEFARYSVCALLCTPLAFLAASPYVLLNYSKFISDFSYEKKHAIRGHTQAIDAWSQFWMYHLARSIVPGAGALTTVAALVGTGALLWRRRMEDLFIVGVILAFYLPAEWVKSKPEPQPERYIFPCLPFLALSAAYAAQQLLRLAPRYLTAPLVLTLLGLPLLRSLELARDIPNDTRSQATNWFIRNVPQQTPVLMEWEPYAPPLSAAGMRSSFILRKNLVQRFTISTMTKSGSEYLVLSSLFYDRYLSQPGASRLLRNRYRSVFSRLPIVAEFNAPSGTYGFHNPRITVFSLRPSDIEALANELSDKEAGKIAETRNEARTTFFADYKLES